jgi:hypothetical protein
MKKIILVLLTLAVLCSFAACGNDKSDTNVTTTGDDQATTEVTTEFETPIDTVVDEGAFSFVLEGVELVPGADFDTAVLPKEDSVYEVPSCAIEGTDLVYNYGIVEVTAFDDGTGPVIYSIYLVDIDTTTTEGLYVGDDLARVTELYGTAYSQNGDELIYTKGKTSLSLILNDNTVISIEYRMVV